MKYLALTIGISLWGVSYAQELDLSGTWNGTSYVLGQPIHMIYEVEQTGSHVSGTVLSINANNSKDSVFYTVEGTLDRRSLELRGLEIEAISDKGISCMAATHKLFYDEAVGQGVLNG